MRLTIILSFLFIIGLFPHSSMMQAPLQKGIHGKVVDLFGEPIADAEVKLTLLTSDKNQTASTDSKGHFFFDPQINGQFEITVRSPGFQVGQYKGSLVNERYSNPINVGLITGSLGDLPLTEVNGRVKLNGKTVSNATVGVINIFNTDVKKSALTNEKGRYCLKIEEPGQYVIFVIVNGMKFSASSLYVSSTIPRKRIMHDFVMTLP